MDLASLYQNRLSAVKASLRGVALITLAALGAAACTHLPVDGPSTAAIVNPDHRKPPQISNYVLIELNTQLAEKLVRTDIKTLRAAFGDQPSAVESLIKPGDYLTVALWEIGSPTPLLGASGSAPTIGTQNETVPEQAVAADGTVAIPFVGRVEVAGLTVTAAEARVAARLKGKASLPQVVIALTRNASNMAAVIGDDIKGLNLTLTPNGDRILDAIAAAGGVESPVYQTQVKLIRNQQSVTVGLQDILSSPSENIHLHPQDVLVVSKNPAVFTMLGALGKNSQFQFQNNHPNLEEALGSGGGLLDERADPKGVFVFRFEPRAFVETICPTCNVARFDAAVPVVYRLNMSRADSFFIGQRFEVFDHDVIFVSNSPRVQLQKFLAMVRDIFSPVLTTAVVARAVQN